MDSIAQPQIPVNLQDGDHYDETINEWIVVIDGQIAGYAEFQGQAWRTYNEALATRRVHRERNPLNKQSLFAGAQSVVLEVS